MIEFDGENKRIIVTTETVLDLSAIYSLARAWEDDNMTAHHVFDVSSELLFTLRYGWKFLPSGYPVNTNIRIKGKLTTTEGEEELKTVPAVVGSPVTWQFDTPATAVLVPVGETVNVWHQPPSVAEISAGLDLSGVSVEVDATAIRTEIDNNSTKLKAIENKVGGLY